MGFYGNITNTSKTQFQFDRIYSNRRAMENKMYTDYVYAGRYVLIEYDSTPDIGAFSRVYMINNVAYKAIQNNSPVMDTRINKSDINIGEIVYDIQTIDKKEKYIFYICTSEREEGNVGPATWKKIDTSDSTNSYIINYNIDIESYGPSRGYDSTVWQKVYIDGYEKYVQIAELNSVVPTFDIAADAPTAEPITPHFDINSTNVYYKLHMQPQWGFRIKENKSKDGNKTSSKDETVYPSDETTQYTKISYDTATGNEKKTEVKYDAAIYYNKDGFNKELRTYYTPDNNVDNIDIIQISPTGVSGNEYNVHKNVYYPVGTQQPDIQELRIILPSLGNTISDIWDLIYGYNVKVNTDESVEITEDGVRFRDIEWKDAHTGEENYELGGMTRDLNTVAGCINKVHDLMGMIITDKNNASLNKEWFEKNYIYKEDNNYYRIHRYPLYTITTLKELDLPKKDNYNSDQEYNEAYRLAIKDKLQDKEYYLIIDSSSPNYKVRTLNEKSIAVLSDNDIIGYQNGEYGYEYLPIPDMPGKMATIYGLILQIKNLLEVEDSETRDQTTVTGAINALNDIIAVFEDLVPGEFLICDENGHVNSANWTTKQEFEYYNHNVLNPIKQKGNNTENRWISLSLDKTDHLIDLKHKFTSVEDTVTIADNNTAEGNGINANNGDELKLYTPIVDSMGHVVGKNIETVTLPYGYKIIKTNGRSNEVTENATSNPIIEDIIADNTKDILTINSGNKWIRIDNNAEDDTLTIRHDVHEILHDNNTTNWTQQEFDTTIPVITYNHDEAGHLINTHTENYQLPFGYGKINSDEGTTAATATYDELTFTSDEWLTAKATKDTITYYHDFTGVEDSKNESDMNNPVKDTIPLYTPKVDDKGHVVGKNVEIVTLPYGYKTFSGDSGTTSADNTQDSISITGDNWINTLIEDDSIKLSHKNPVIGTANAKNNDTPNFGSTFIIDDHYFDEKGHKFESKTHTIRIPELSLSNGTGNVVTGLSLSPTAGAFTETKSNLGAIQLGTFEKGDSSADIAADITLQQALSRLENKISNEVNERKNAIDALDVIDNAVTGQYVSSVNEENGKIIVSRLNLPTYTLTPGSANGTIAFNNVNVAVTGLGSAAYTNANAYATFEQGQKADSALQNNTIFDYNNDKKTIAELFALVAELSAKVQKLEEQLNSKEEDNETT